MDKTDVDGCPFFVVAKEFMKSMVNTKLIDYTGSIKGSEG